MFQLSRPLAGRGPFAALHSALWLRLLDARDLDDITVDSYASRTQSGFESAKHNLGGLWPWEEKAFAEFIAPASRVLVAGAGGGREMIALARAGHCVVGFDAAPDLVEACRRHLALAGVEGEIHDAPAGRVPPSLGDRFDALVIGRGVYHHLPRRARRVEFLRACRAQLVDGAALILGDFLVRKPDGRAPRRAARGVEAGDHVGSSFFHRFTHSEISAELEEAGFDRIDYRATPCPGDSALAHAIARAGPVGPA